ncbi:MAG: hypothetical protein ACHQF2_04655 [Flavobacteriales bacterium]
MKQTLILFSFLFAVNHELEAQKFDNPVEYMQHIQTQQNKISKDTWSYISAVAHSKSAKKIESKRKEVIKTTKDAIAVLKKLGGYGEDKGYRDTVLAYLELSYLVITEDYEKIVNLEEVAEQSYDAMEAYLLAQEIAGKKLRGAGDRVSTEEARFAKDHNIELVDSKDGLAKKMEKADEVLEYYNKVYLIFFKSYKQEAYMADAQARNDANSLEQNKNTLNDFAKDGLKKMKEIGNYINDPSLSNATKDLLEFYVFESGDDSKILTDYIVKKENFDKIKAAFEAKKEKDRVQADYDQINAAGQEFNKTVNDFNKKNEELFKKRKDLIDRWNKTAQSFLDKHVPQK